MMAFILKLRKLEVRLINKNFDAKRTLEDGASDAGSSEFFTDAKPGDVNVGTKRYGDSFDHFYRKHRKSARPKFLAGR